MSTSLPWLEQPNDRPGDGKEYWVVQYRFFSSPTKATWNDTDLTWRTSEYSDDVPWWVFPWFREISV